MLVDDLPQEGKHPGPRKQVRGPESGDGRIAPEPGTDGDAREGHGISQARPDGAVRHREPELLGEECAHDLGRAEPLTGLPGARDPPGHLDHLGHVVRDRLPGERGAEGAAEVAVPLARRGDRVVPGPELVGEAAIDRCAVEVPLAAAQEECVGLRAGENRVVAPRSAQPVDRADLVIAPDERGQGIAVEVEAVAEDGQARRQGREATARLIRAHGRARMHRAPSRRKALKRRCASGPRPATTPRPGSSSCTAGSPASPTRRTRR